MSLILIFIAGIGYIVRSLYIDLMIHGDIPYYSYLAKSILVIAFAVFFVISWKFYCTEWRRLSGGAVIEALFEKILFPLITIYLVTPKGLINGAEQIDSVMVFFGILFFISAVDVDSSIARIVHKKFQNMNATNRKYLYSTYPPRVRGDILPLELIVLLMTIVMIIRKLT